MSLVDVAGIALSLFANFALLWAAIFFIVCVLLGIIVSLVLLAMSRL
jgi:hypothetical protein